MIYSISMVKIGIRKDKSSLLLYVIVYFFILLHQGKRMEKRLTIKAKICSRTLQGRLLQPKPSLIAIKKTLPRQEAAARNPT